MRICDQLVRDEWYWSGERDGIYSVRSAYRLMVKQAGEMEGYSSESSDSWLWNKICRVPVLPRIKDPLELDLPSCSGFARARDWVEVALREMGSQEGVELMTGCWAIWERRNKAIFEDGDWRADLVVRRVRDLVCKMAGSRSLTDDGVVCGVVDDGECWRRPESGVLKVNVDAAVIDGWE
ncbi:uncharacterized protein LOC141602108 [Silene latifolia]|uniref:uncharacterized protein LOC141602108 n=1 Tax=Silene latifolia TaxID=37657 RepID=UPI003D78017B